MKPTRSEADGHPQRDLPIWRSLLFVPLSVEKFVRRAIDTRPDAIVLDLEDGVAPNAKDAARDNARQVADRCAAAGIDVLVRINQPLRLAVRDIEACVSPSVHALMLPKMSGATHVRLLADVVASVEAERSMPPGVTRFFPVAEDVSALPRMTEIAAAHARVVAFTCGTEDLATSMGSTTDPDVLRYPKQLGVIAARQAGVLPLGLFGSSAQFRDLALYREAAHLSKRFGVVGATCIHPSQVPILNEVFSPTQAEVAYALRVVAESERAFAQGQGAFAIDGAMVDEPIVARCRQIVRRHQAISDRAIRQH